ncbi:MAG: hypothetical protein ACPG3V_02095 [Porticoccaceae bacterium]
MDKFLQYTGDLISRSCFIVLIGLLQYRSIEHQEFLFYYVLSPLLITLITGGRYVALAQYSIGRSFHNLAYVLNKYWRVFLSVTVLLIFYRLIYAYDSGFFVAIDLVTYLLAVLFSRYYIEHLRASKKHKALIGYFKICLGICISILTMSIWFSPITLIFIASFAYLIVSIMGIISSYLNCDFLSSGSEKFSFAIKGQNYYLLASFLVFFLLRNIEKFLANFSGFPHMQEYLICCVWGSYFMTAINQINNIMYPKLISKLRDGESFDVWRVFSTRILTGLPFLVIFAIPFFFLYAESMNFLNVKSFKISELAVIFSGFLFLAVLQIISPYMNLTKKTILIRIMTTCISFILAVLFIIFISPFDNMFIYYPFLFYILSIIFLLWAIFVLRPNISTKDYKK